MIDQKTAQALKDKGVDPSIILDLMLEQDAAPAMNENQEKPEQEEKKPEPKQEQKPDPDPILAAINKLTGAIQASNILNSGSKGPAAETSEDILAQLINPKKEEK